MDHGRRAERTYPVVVASGSYREMGEQIGRAAAASIGALCAMYAEDDSKPGASPRLSTRRARSALTSWKRSRAWQLGQASPWRHSSA